MAIKNAKLGGLNFSTPTARIKPTDLNDTFNAVVDTTDAKLTALAPVGSIVAWMKSMTGTPSLPTNWVECNGQTLSDANSVYNGLTIPNLNGASAATPLFLRGATASGSTGGAESHIHKWYDYGNDPGNYDDSLQMNNNAGDGAVSYDASGAETQISSGGSYLNHDAYTNSQSSLPSYYSVVWIMRVK